MDTTGHGRDKEDTGATNRANAGAADPAGQDLEARIRDALGGIAEILALRPLSDEERAHITGLEAATEEGGAAGGMLELVNEGLREALACDLVYAALTGPMLEDPPHPWTIMVDDDEQLIGEWLPESRRDEVRATGRAVFLSPDFVLYKDRKPRGKGKFLMPFICVPLEGGDGGLSTCGIGTPSGPADEYIRGLMGNPDKDIATLVVGISVVAPFEVSRDQGAHDE